MFQKAAFSGGLRCVLESDVARVCMCIARELLELQVLALSRLESGDSIRIEHREERGPVSLVNSPECFRYDGAGRISHDIRWEIFVAT
jgi:L-arabinose isomerase